MIPKIIHYCWLSGDPIPEQLQRCMESWKKYLPDYEFMLWDLKRFDVNQTLWTKQAFEAKKYAFAADYIRLYAVYNYGGIYMDMDVEVVKPFGELLDAPYILGVETQDGIEAGVFGAMKHNPYIGKCLEYYKNRSFILQDGNLDTRPLPKIMYEVLTKNYSSMERTSFKIDDEEMKECIEVFSPEFLTAKSYETGEIKRTSLTYTIHHFAASWHGRKEKLYRFVNKMFGERFAQMCSRIYKSI